MRIAAIIVAAGESRRFKSPISKLATKLGEKEVFRHSYDTIVSSALFDQIVVVTSIDRPFENSVLGGSSRQESCYLGLLACKDIDYVVIHDAARPFLTHEILQRNIDAVIQHGAVTTAIPSHDTISIVQDGKIDSIPNRENCWRTQTPQSFSYPLILEAHEKYKGRNASDDASLILQLGHKVHVVLGSNENFKITTPIDLAFAEAIYYTQVSSK